MSHTEELDLGAATTLMNVLRDFEGKFKPYVLTNVELDVKEIVGDKNKEKYRKGSDAIIVDIEWKGQCRYVSKKLHSVFFKPDTHLDGMKYMLLKFCKEIQLMCELNHENVVKFEGIYYETSKSLVASSLPVLVMEKMPFSLTEYINTFGYRNIPENDVINILCDVARGLIYLHDKTVVHGDLSSNNILLTKAFCTKIADFGSAQVLRMCHELEVQPGTPDFMPPEALIYPACYTVSVDVFSLGCVIIHLTTGQWPTPVGEMFKASELLRRQQFLAMIDSSHLLLPIVKRCLEVKETRPTSKDVLISLSEIKCSNKIIINGDQLDKAFKMIKEGEGGMKKALQYLLSMSVVSNSHVPIEDFHSVVPGDHLVYNTTIGWKINFYVLASIGKGCIKVVGTFLEGNDDPFIEEKLIFDDDKTKQLKIMERTLCESQCKNISKILYKGISNVLEEKDRLEKFKDQNKPYSFPYNNSEHFVTYVKEGEAKCEMCSKEIEIVFKKYAFVKAAQDGSLKSAKPLFDGSSSWGILVGAITGRSVGITATKQATTTTAKEAVKEVGKVATKQAATTTAKEAVKEVGKAATKQAATTTAKEAVKEVGKAATMQAATTTAKEVVKEAGKAATKQAATTTAKEAVKGVGKAATKQAATTTAKEAVKEVGKAATMQAATTTAKEVVKEAGKAATKQAATTTAKEAMKGVGKAATKQAATTTAKEAVKAVGKTATKQAATTTAKEAVKEVGKAATKRAATTTAKEAVKEVGKAATKQAATTTANEVVKEAGKAATKQAATTTAKEAVKGVGKAATKLAATTTAKEAVKAVGKTATKQAATTTAKEAVKEVGKAATKRAATTTAKEAVKEVGKAATKQAATTTAKEAVKGVGKAATKQAATTTAKEAVKGVGKAATKQAATTTAKEAVKEVGKAATKQAATTTTKEAVKEVGKAATKQAATTTAKETVKEVGKTATKQAATTAAKEATKEVGKTATKQAAANAVRQSLRASVVSGLLIESGLYAAQMAGAVYKRANGQMDPEEFVDFTIEQTATSGGSAAGGISGSLAGVAAGAAVGSVVPVIGTAIGAFAGGLLGGVTGGVGGNLLGKQVGGLINSTRENNEWKLDCNTPNDIAVAHNNELIILDSFSPKALVVSTELTIVKELSFSNAAIVKPSGIAVSGTTMAVGDRSNHVVKILSFEAKYLSMIKTTESKEGDFPFRMQFNSKGVLYVLDFCNGRVQAFDTKKNNAFCGIVGCQGSDPGQYQQPECIAVDGSDNVYVTDCFSKCINMYSRDGHAFLYKIDCLCRPCAIAFSPDDHLIVGDHENNCIRVFGLPYKNSFFKGLFGYDEKEHSRKLTNIFGTVGNEKEEFNEISGIVVNSYGTLCVVESKNVRLQLISTSIWRKTMDENDIKKYEERFKLSNDKTNGQL